MYCLSADLVESGHIYHCLSANLEPVSWDGVTHCTVTIEVQNYSLVVGLRHVFSWRNLLVSA